MRVILKDSDIIWNVRKISGTFIHVYTNNIIKIVPFSQVNHFYGVGISFDIDSNIPYLTT